MNDERITIDTNILIYSIDMDANDGRWILTLNFIQEGRLP